MKWRTLSAISAGISLLFPTLLLAKPDFKLDGRINFELQSEESFDRADLAKEATLELETRRENGFKGELEVRITSDSGTLELRELALEHENDSGGKLLVGQDRKSFGLDWEYRVEKRIALNRGIVNDQLSKLSYVGRDTLIRYRPGRAEDAGLTHDLSFHTANGLNGAILYGVKWWLGSGTFLGSTTLGQLNRVENRGELSAAQAFSFSRREGDFRLDAEFFLGEDHLETEYNEFTENPQTELFSALQAMTALRLGRYEPFLRLAGVFHDLSSLSNRTLELTAGARLYFMSDLYLGAQVQTRQSRYDESTPPPPSETEALAVLRYFF